MDIYVLHPLKLYAPQRMVLLGGFTPPDFSPWDYPTPMIFGFLSMWLRPVYVPADWDTIASYVYSTLHLHGLVTVCIAGCIRGIRTVVS